MFVQIREADKGYECGKRGGGKKERREWDERGLTGDETAYSHILHFLRNGLA